MDLFFFFVTTSICLCLTLNMNLVLVSSRLSNYRPCKFKGSKLKRRELNLYLSNLFRVKDESFGFGICGVCRMRVVVMENGLRRVRVGKVKEKAVQESLRSKAVSHLRSLQSKTTFMSELEEVKLLIATVLQKE